MKNWLLVLLFSVAAIKLPAQTNLPVRLALIAESDEAMAAADVLTAQLSGNQKIQLLERNEIEKAYREQGLSAANRNDLKLGRILGADGVLLLGVVKTSESTNLTARLIAVKPGVVLLDEKFSWPPVNTADWSSSFAGHLDLFLPKLTVLAKDAIPISIVNLRAAISSPGEQETERDLKLLTIQRLTQEPQFFVLERQRMQLLSEEKELESDESAFWDGSYLLDGTVDQNGYSRDTVTINARLAPKKGGSALTFEVKGSRTNLAEVINRLATNVTALLKVNSTVKEWNAPDEAAQYYDEAKWALRWGVCAEAQAAADSAWALGKKDLACDLVRIRAYISQIPKVIAPNMNYYQNLDDYRNQKMDPHYVHINEPPDSKYCDIASYSLNCYYEFSRVSPEGESRVLWKETPQARGLGWHDWHNSDWYQLGIDSLTAASEVLQHFNYVPESQKPVADKLADLRARARSVAELISRSPSVHDSYFVGDRIAARDELAFTIGEENPKNSSIFNCEVQWGCFWQERPEDTIELYRTLMSSPAFSYIHKHLWIRPAEQPRLVTWNAEGEKRIPVLWNNFMSELGDSTNIFLQLEAKAFQLADAQGDEQLSAAFTNLFNGLLANRDALVACNVEVLYLDWGTGELVRAKTGNGIVTDTGESLGRRFYSEYYPKLQAMDQEYWNKTVRREEARTAGKDTGEAFGRQVEYLKNKTPYNWFDFNKVFGPKNYTKAQVTELLPLLAAYQSNLIAQAKDKPTSDQVKANNASNWVEFYVGKRAREVLNPSPQRLNSQVKVQLPRPVPAPGMTVTVPVATHVPEMATNILLVNSCLKIPVDQAPADASSAFHITGQYWSEGKLLVGLAYGREITEFDKRSNWQFTRTATFSAIAVFNPDKETWNIINGFEMSDIELVGLSRQTGKNPMVLFHGNLYLLEAGVIREFDFGKRQWRTLPVPKLEADQLFTVGEHLLATGRNSIFEITENGAGTRVLASTRRRPTISTLDSLDNFGSPVLFAGPEDSLCASIADKIYRWDGNDWRGIVALNISRPPEVFEDAVVFRSIPQYDPGNQAPGSLWVWAKDRSPPELCLHDDPKPSPLAPHGWQPPAPDSPGAKPLWKSLDDDHLTGSAATFFKSDLYLFSDHANPTNILGHWTVSERNGYHARLVCLSRDLVEPVVVPLKFNLQLGQPPLKILGGKMRRGAPWETASTWMHFAGNKLYIGRPDVPVIWTIPASEVEAAIATQKQVMHDQ